MPHTTNRLQEAKLATYVLMFIYTYMTKIVLNISYMSTIQLLDVLKDSTIFHYSKMVHGKQITFVY